MITEAEPDDIVLVNKSRKSARRLKYPSELFGVFHILGSNLNPILTQLARTRRVLFVEGKHFQIISKYAHKLKYPKVSIRSGFAVVPIEGFNPQRARSLKLGMETTLGGKILCGAVLDRDYRSKAECESIASECRSFCEFVVIHSRKEIENFLLVPDAIDRAATKRITDHAVRSDESFLYTVNSRSILEDFATEKKDYVMAQHLADRRRFERASSSTTHETTITQMGLKEFGECWQTFESRMSVIPGKEALSSLNQRLQQECKISITPTGIIDAMKPDEVPTEMRSLIVGIDLFAAKTIPS
jgi:hypothetical protein